MAQKRARLSDNDPVSPTDRVLAGFEQHSKLTSQQVDQPTSQENDQLASQEDGNTVKQQADTSTSQEPKKPTGQQVNKSSGQKSVKSSGQVASKLKEADASVAELTDKSDSQQVDKPAIRKATFQISDTVLRQLDTFHLQLQLDLGKANAPYKEVIVEQAIVQILTQALSDRSSLIAALQERQQQRD